MKSISSQPNHLSKKLKLLKHLAPYVQCFSSPLYSTFKYIILGFINLQEQSLTAFSCSQIRAKCISSFSYFFNQGKWDEKDIQEKRLSVLKNRKETRFSKKDIICLDDTSLAKKGQFFEFIHACWDEVDEKVKDGYLMFVAGIVSRAKGIKYVFDFELFSILIPGIKSKWLTVMKLLDRVFKTAKASLIVMDQGFKNKYLLKFILEKDRHFLLRISPSMVWWIKKKRGELKKIKMRDISRQKKSKARFYHWQGLRIWIKQGLVNAWQTEIKKELTILVIDKQGFKKRMYLATDLEIRSAKEALEIYQAYLNRWNIEEIFKDLKEHFGLEKFRLRRLKAIKRYITLVVVAYTILSTKLWQLGKLDSLKKIIICLLKMFRKVKELALGGLKKFYEMLYFRQFDLMPLFNDP